MEGDWRSRVIEVLREWYGRMWLEWFDDPLPHESADYLAKVAFRCVDSWVQVASTALSDVDSLLRREGVEITINVTDITAGARSAMSLATRKGTITIPLTLFPKMYAAALSACEGDDPSRAGRYRLDLEEDPFERPLGRITFDANEPSEIAFWKPALIRAVNAVLIIALHELAHCVLGHRDSGLTSVEMRLQEVEADILAGVFYTGLDPRMDEHLVGGSALWGEGHAMDFARAAALVAAFLRAVDSKSSASEADRHHHRATARYYHLAFGVIQRLRLVAPERVGLAQRAIELAPASLAFGAVFSPLERYAEGEQESVADWKSFETETAPLAPQLSEKLRHRRLPVLARLLEPRGSEMKAGVKTEIEFGREAITEVVGALKRLDGQPYDTAQMHAIALHASVIELLASCLAMADEDGASAGIPIVLRSMYEVLVDLDNLRRDPAYLDLMEAANLKQMCKLLEQADTNPLLRRFSARFDVSALLAEFRARRVELKAQGKEPLKIEDRCDRVGRKAEYLSLYGLFCMDSHNNMAALADRHFDEVGGALTVSVFAQPHVPSVRRRLSTGIDFMLTTARMLHDAFSSDPPELARVARRYVELREKWIAEDG